VKTFLKEAVAATGLHAISGYAVHQWHDKVVGFVVIAESHVSVHLEGNGTGWIDVFSCRPVDTRAMSDLASVVLGGFWAGELTER